MSVIILIAALAIDVSIWYSQRHQAQVTADSAALAAANYMSTTPSASPATATTQAQTYAADNGLAISPSNVVVSIANSTVTVTAPTTGPLIFAGITLKSDPAISAQAEAAWLGHECTSGASGCAFAYAADNVCTGSTGVSGTGGGSGNPNGSGAISHGVTLNENGVGSGTRITGDVVSASDITTNVNNNDSYASAATYSNGTGCTGPTPGTPSQPFTSASQQAVASKFPVDYRLIYPACSVASTTSSSKFGTMPACDGNGFPAYCSTGGAVESIAASLSVSSPANVIYCDAGTGNTQDPSTWNGTINVSGGGTGGTFIGGTVNFTGNNLPGPATGGTYDSNLLAYGAQCNASSPLPATCPTTTHTTTSNPAVDIGSAGGGTISGDLFAPAGVIDVHLAGSLSLTGFLEGWDVVYNVDGTVTGDGPPVTTSGTFEYDWLAQ